MTEAPSASSALHAQNTVQLRAPVSAAPASRNANGTSSRDSTPVARPYNADHSALLKCGLVFR